MTFSFKITHKDKNSFARTGIMETSNGKVETPYFIPVATRANIIALTDKDIKDLKIPCLLSNTYHLHLKPGEKEIKKKNGLHGYMNFKGVIFTDSGGFQAMSLGEGRESGFAKLGITAQRANILAKNLRRQSDKNLVKITDKGVYFKSVYDNSDHFINAKKSMEIQSDLGSDCIMAFDECTTANKSLSYQKEALERTNKWAKLSLKYHDKSQALYGIIQGGKYKTLRTKSTKFILENKFDGIAIGGSFGESYGDSKQDMLKVMDWISPLISKDKLQRPVHMLGIGWIDDIFPLVEKGIDTFDCVHTTRISRHGNLYISPDSGGAPSNKFRIKIKRSIFKEDKSKIDINCTCKVCKKYTRADMHKLAKTDKFKFGRLATIHNLHFMLEMMKSIRQSIKDDKFQELKQKWLQNNN
jgi:tRNA-guanine transglycosylase